MPAMANQFTCYVNCPTRARHIGRQALSGIRSVVASPYTHPPATELLPPGWSQGNSQKIVLFVTEKQPTSIDIGWRLHPMKSSAFHSALLHQLGIEELMSGSYIVGERMALPSIETITSMCPPRLLSVIQTKSQLGSLS